MNLKKLGNLFGTRLEICLGLSLIIALLLPHTSSALMLVNPLLCLLFILPKKKRVLYEVIYPIVAIIVSIFVNFTGGAGEKSFLTAISTILFLFAFPLVSNVRVKNIYIYMTFVLIFLSQVGYMFNLGLVTSIVDKYYPITWNEASVMNMINGASLDNYSDYRFGGLYRNPNHCAKYVSFLLAIFLVNNRATPIKKQLLFIIFCFISILLSGSRTGFIVASLLTLFALLNNKKASIFHQRVGILVGVSSLLYLIIYSNGDARGISIEDGLKDSAGAKFALTIKYILSESSIIHLLFGHLDLSLFKSPFSYSLDCEYGYIIYCFGFVGLFAFIYALFKLFNKVEKQDRFFYLLLLWMISSSIFMAYRAAFAFILLLSTIYQQKTNKIKT